MNPVDAWMLQHEPVHLALTGGGVGRRAASCCFGLAASCSLLGAMECLWDLLLPLQVETQQLVEAETAQARELERSIAAAEVRINQQAQSAATRHR